MTNAEMTAELAKLNVPQRDRLRDCWGASVSSITVEKRGHKTVVDFVGGGIRQVVTLGPRGMLLDRRFA